MGQNNSKKSTIENEDVYILVSKNDEDDIDENKGGVTYLNPDYSFCIFCDKYTIIKNMVHCGFCDSCHYYNIYNCKKSDLYYETMKINKSL